MRNTGLILRSIYHYRWIYIGVVLGTALATAVVSGALIAGDSVRQSLLDLVSARLGRATYALSTDDRFFDADLDNRISAELGDDGAAVISLRGMALHADGEGSINRLQVLGVERSFWELAASPVSFPHPADGEAVVSEVFARRLGVQVGDEFVLRVSMPELFPGDMPLAQGDGSPSSTRLKVSAVARADEMGRFSLRSDQKPVPTIYLSRNHLGRLVDMAGRANLLLLAGNARLKAVDDALAQVWRPDDIDVSIETLPGNRGYQLVSGRFFLSPAVEEAALRAGTGGRGILTYLVNSITVEDRDCPYSFVSAPGPEGLMIPRGSIVVNQWLADDLAISKNDTAELAFYVESPMKTLVEKKRTFRVSAVVPLAGAAADPELMPFLSGITGAETCADWDGGDAIDSAKIRPKDEEYWNNHRGTPKAFVNPEDAREMWRSRTGALTAVRYPARGNTPDDLSAEIMKDISPAAAGMSFVPVRAEGERASAGSVGFGGLFIGLSFFIVTAAMLLVGLLFSFTIQYRSREIGTLAALGYSQRRIRGLLIAESFVVGLIGSLLGLIGAVLYGRGVIAGLMTIWRGAVGTDMLESIVRPAALAGGVWTGVEVCVIAAWVVTRRLSRISPAVLMNRTGGIDGDTGDGRGWGWLAAGAVSAAAVILVWAFTGKEVRPTGAFFSSGTLLLVAGVACIYRFFAAGCGPGGKLTFFTLALKGCSARPGRSTAVAAVLACGVFVMIAVGANRKNAVTKARVRQSGTGGFVLYGETSVPVLHDLNSDRGRDRFGLNEPEMKGVSFVQMRVKEGDDASCLNLNRAERPRLLGVDPDKLSSRGAFSFADTGNVPASPWSLLAGRTASGRVPAVADQSVITWGLGKSVGDTIVYTDEKGDPFEVELVASLAGSVLQGDIIISEDAFLDGFPSVSGTRVFLIDVPETNGDKVKYLLTKRLRDRGLEMEETTTRLADFLVVENTYLSIFLELGGLGLLLGSCGLGLVVLRNMAERRGELALLGAVGFSRGCVFRMVFMEHCSLLVGGLLCGLISAVVAVIPVLRVSGTDIPVRFIGIVSLGIVINGMVWTAAATGISLRGNLIRALRSE